MDFEKFISWYTSRISFPLRISLYISLLVTREESINFSWAKLRCYHSLLSIDLFLSAHFGLGWDGVFCQSVRSSARDTIGNLNISERKYLIAYTELELRELVTWSRVRFSDALHCATFALPFIPVIFLFFLSLVLFSFIRPSPRVVSLEFSLHPSLVHSRLSCVLFYQD